MGSKTCLAVVFLSFLLSWLVALNGCDDDDDESGGGDDDVSPNDDDDNDDVSPNSDDDDDNDDNNNNDDSTWNESCEHFVTTYLDQCPGGLFDLDEEEALLYCKEDIALPWDCILDCWYDNNEECALWYTCVTNGCLAVDRLFQRR